VRCKDRVAIVTGAAGNGMGRSTALTLAREGARVVVNYRTSEQAAARVVQAIAQRGGQAIAVQADVFDRVDCARLVERTSARYGRVDICVIGPGADWHPEPPHEIAPEQALRAVEQELAPVYNLLPLVLPGMYQHGWGRVIALSLAPPYASPAFSYNVAKAARTHALLLARDQAWRHGVTVNVIGPGPVPEVPSLAEAISLCEHRGVWNSRRTASPQDIAEGVAFLCSEEARFISGCVLPYMFRS